MIEKMLGRHAEAIYAVLRVVAGGLLSCHGLQKIAGVWATTQPAPFTQLWIGGVIELVCGALVALGLATRSAAFVASGTMAVAYIQFHWKGHFDRGFFPIVNKGELAVIDCFVFLLVAAKGAGRFSVDASRRGSSAR